jgi:hypothetical protein
VNAETKEQSKQAVDAHAFTKQVEKVNGCQKSDGHYFLGQEKEC